MVLEGKRLPSQDMIRRLSRQLKHTNTEHTYFELLVQLERAKRRGKGVEEVFDEIRKLKVPAQGNTILSSQTFAYISEWYHLVIKQLVETPSFEEDPSWIRKRLRNKVTISEIQCAIEAMLSLGILKRDDSQRLCSSNKCVTTKTDVANIAVQIHHKQMLDRAKEAISEHPTLEREVDSKTFRMDPNRMKEAKEFLRRQRNEFLRNFEDKDSNHVFQFNFQLFKHTGEKKE